MVSYAVVTVLFLCASPIITQTYSQAAPLDNKTEIASANITTNLLEPLTETTSFPNEEFRRADGLFDMEIISIEVVPDRGNSVALAWGRPIRGYDLNWTFGVFYGKEDEALTAPRLQTKELYAVVDDLQFCSKYIFAVGVMDANNGVAQHSPGNIRSIGTLVDERFPPENLQVEFIPGEHPCLLIKWSASCPNIGRPLGYLVTIMEQTPSRMTIITEPRTLAIDLSQTLRVIHGKSYDVKVSTDVPGSGPTATVSYRIPLFLQPYKVRLTSQPDGTFMMYWREPFVPYYVGPYFYEVYVYPGRNLTSKYEAFTVNKPIFTFKGNETEYTFMVGIRSYDGAYKSYLTDPVAAAVDGKTETLNIS